MLDSLRYSWVGIFIIVFISYIPMLLIGKPTQKKWVLFAAFTVVITAHHFLSLWNIWYWPLPGAELDAFNFHRNAEDGVIIGVVPPLSIGSDFYEHMLFRFYTIFGNRLIAGQILSIIVASFGCIAVLYIAKILGITNVWLHAGLIIVVGFTPSFLYYTSLTFREPFQLLPYILGVGFSLKAIYDRSPWLLFLSVFCFILMGLFHQVLLAAAFVMLLIAIAFYYIVHARGNLYFNFIKLLILGIFLFGLGCALLLEIPVQSGNNYLEIIRTTDGLLHTITYYRNAVDEALPRSSYGYTISANSYLELFFGLLKSYIYYLFGPWFWSLNNINDIIPMLNSLGRFFVFLVVLYGFVISDLKKRWEIYFLVTHYVFLSFLWSIATTNYGQAFRHHVTTDWLLILLLFYILYRYSGQSNKNSSDD